jgi:hypothetical protein
MRAFHSIGLAYPGVIARARSNSGWLQAGLKSSAYRLAHLALPRPALICAVASFFYLF